MLTDHRAHLRQRVVPSLARWGGPVETFCELSGPRRQRREVLHHKDHPHVMVRDLSRIAHDEV